MGDGRTELFRSMWTRTTTNDSINNPELYTKVKGKKIKYDNQFKYMPDQKLHRNVSFVKSGFRIAACIFGMIGMIPAAFGLLFLAEIVGIYEELV
jgi:ABC-type transport system involved in Fe-S cluster assembly fused permease/ATPase subunit